MEIDTSHNFGILAIGVQKNSQIHVFHGLINFAGICVKNQCLDHRADFTQ